MLEIDLIQAGDILTLKTQQTGYYQVRVKEIGPSYHTANGLTRTMVVDQWRFSPGDEWIPSSHTQRVSERDSVTIEKI